MIERRLRFPAIVLAGFTFVACSGGDDPVEAEAPNPGHEHKDPDGGPNIEDPGITDNKRPTAIAGPDRVVPIGSEVELDGTKSSDPDGDPLSFAWTIIKKPSGSEASFDDGTSPTPRFVVDKAGEYEIELTISDGIASAKDTVVIRGNREPIADAGGDQSATVGTTVVLNGSGSSDPDGDPLSFEWALISSPSGSNIALQKPNSAMSSFKPDLVGEYTFELTVSDGHAQARARATVDVGENPIEKTRLYVSPTGDDSGEGSSQDPLQTISEAFDRAASNPDIRRFILAAGVYEEEFGHQLSRGIEISGPADGEDLPVLKGPGNLFTVKNGALQLFRVHIESGDVAIRMVDGGGLSLTGVECRAKACIVGTDDDDEQRPAGPVGVSRSRLSGAEKTAAGISLAHGTLTITDSIVENFGSGIALTNTRLFMRETTIQGNENDGLSIRKDNTGGSLIGESVIEANEKTALSIHDSKDITLRGIEVKRRAGHMNSERGIDVSGTSAIQLDGVRIAGFGLGMRIESNGDGVIKLRKSHIVDNLNGIEIAGEGSRVDLGNESEAGENVVSSLHIDGNSRGYAIDDIRPANASGFIMLSATKLAGADVFPAGSYAHPYCPTSPRTICIANEGNVVLAH